MDSSMEIHIDELVLEGFEAHDQEGISDGLRQALTRLFMEKGLPRTLTQNSRYPGILAGDFNLAPGTKPHSIGEAIATTVFSGFENNQHPNKK